MGLQPDAVLPAEGVEAAAPANPEVPAAESNPVPVPAPITLGASVGRTPPSSPEQTRHDNERSFFLPREYDPLKDPSSKEYKEAAAQWNLLVAINREHDTASTSRQTRDRPDVPVLRLDELQRPQARERASIVAKATAEAKARPPGGGMRDFMPEGAEETDALGTWYTSVADPLPLAIAEEEAVEMMTDQGGTIPTDQFIRQCQRERELEFERLRLETEQHLREQWGLEQARRAEEQMQIEAYYSAQRAAQSGNISLSSFQPRASDGSTLQPRSPAPSFGSAKSKDDFADHSTDVPSSTGPRIFLDGAAKHISAARTSVAQTITKALRSRSPTNVFGGSSSSKSCQKATVYRLPGGAGGDDPGDDGGGKGDDDRHHEKKNKKEKKEEKDRTLGIAEALYQGEATRLTCGLELFFSTCARKLT